ncbi:hypothetical protein FD25_GL002143 [Levilactobacillus acidifarinae DSM 19394]|uniref:Uncharacterized protein n=1 Tax=Levilactobacillus acidifarinae DSM 19394 = JCM 15949 TaxID=1423715 RepID=A0A0R1LGG1_9LACO|nr:hypothetical protein FD25_GL002143 [Levilactobacillus acidifarinae DSM 19394]
MMDVHHTIGEILRTIRYSSYQDDLRGLKHDLMMFDIPDWYYLNLEHSQADHLPPEKEDLLLRFFALDPAILPQLRTAPDLQQAVNDAMLTLLDKHAWQFRRLQLPWPDSAQVAQHFDSPQNPDPDAKFRYADLLRFLRVTILKKPVVTLADYFDLPPLIYWQMETAQKPLTADMVAWLKEVLNTDDLRQYTHADDLMTAVDQAHDGGFVMDL